MSLVDLSGRLGGSWDGKPQARQNLVIYVDDFQPNSITRVVTFKRKGKCDDDIIAHRQKVSHPYTLFGVSIFPIPRLLWIRIRHRQSSSPPTQQVTSGIPTWRYRRLEDSLHLTLSRIQIVVVGSIHIRLCNVADALHEVKFKFDWDLLPQSGKAFPWHSLFVLLTRFCG